MCLYNSLSSWIDHFLACMGQCCGLLYNSRPAGDKPSISDGFWSTSTYDLLDNAAFRSNSSITLSNQTLSQLNATASSNNPPEFVNHGLRLWTQTRLQWVGAKKPQTHKKAREPVLSWNASYDSLLVTNKLFPQPVPLSEMVDFLVDVWDQEGLL